MAREAAAKARPNPRGVELTSLPRSGHVRRGGARRRSGCRQRRGAGPSLVPPTAPGTPDSGCPLGWEPSVGVPSRLGQQPRPGGDHGQTHPVEAALSIPIHPPRLPAHQCQRPPSIPQSGVLRRSGRGTSLRTRRLSFACGGWHQISFGMLGLHEHRGSQMSLWTGRQDGHGARSRHPGRRHTF